MMRAIGVLGILLLTALFVASAAQGFPGGGPGLGMLPVTDATPPCAACHAITKPEYMRDVPPDAPLNATN